MRQLGEVKAVAGTGLEGDRYSIGVGTFSKPGPGYEITLIEIEAIEALREKNMMLAAGHAPLRALLEKANSAEISLCLVRPITPCK